VAPVMSAPAAEQDLRDQNGASETRPPAQAPWPQPVHGSPPRRVLSRRTRRPGPARSAVL